MAACLTQGAGAQFNVSGPGFLPDENGTNPDEPQAKKVGRISIQASATRPDAYGEVTLTISTTPTPVHSKLTAKSWVENQMVTIQLSVLFVPESRTPTQLQREIPLATSTPRLSALQGRPWIHAPLSLG